MATEIWTVGRVLEVAAQRFRERGIDTHRLDAELLLAAVLGCDRTRLYLDLMKPLADDERARYRESVRRRSDREPVAYITGRRGFWEGDFLVTPGVLVPRPETESIVERALDVAKDLPDFPRLRVLDLGVGSGALALSLARELPEAEVWGVDASDAALACAEANRARFGLEGRVTLLKSAWFDAIDPEERFDLIVANPPYIPGDDIAGLMPEVSRWEPRAALDGGPDGLRDIRAIVASAPVHLRRSGWLLMEFGEGQEDAVLALAQAEPRLDAPRIFRDYAGRPRVLAARGRETTAPAPTGCGNPHG